MRSPMNILAVVAAVSTLAAAPARAQQGPDTTWVPSVARPAYAANGPRVGIDEAHQNFHTATGNDRPFAMLLRCPPGGAKPTTLDTPARYGDIGANTGHRNGRRQR